MADKKNHKNTDPNILQGGVKYVFLFFIYLIAFISNAADSSNATDFCNITPLNSQSPLSSLQLNTTSKLLAKRGTNEFQLNCSLKHGGVLSFLRPGLDSFTWQQNDIIKQPLKSGQIAFLMDSGSFTAVITLESKLNYTPRFKWQNTQLFFKNTQQHNLIMGAFYGLCITLIFYVLIMGYRLHDSIFKLYSAYIFCIGSFVLLQEGQLYLFITEHVSSLLFDLYLLSIGLTVLSATWFICALLELNTSWPKTSKALKIMASIVMCFCLIRILFSNILIWKVAGNIMAYGSLVIVTIIFILAALQARKGIHEATLVVIALSLVLVSMIFRVLLINQNPFMQRYGFILAFAIESFLLAVAVSRRISRMRIAKKQAESEANYDHLCNILNRRGWSKKSNLLIKQHSEQSGILCLMYIDLDNFKQINDTYGHDSGDKVLCCVANYLKNSMRRSDAVGRIGGDEFVVLAHFNNNDEVNSKVHELERQLNELVITLNGNKINIHASVGLTNFNVPPHSIDQILKAGDSAMYQQKMLRKVKPLTLVDG
ncbi:diguanylate cyclase [Pseudoalteromonas distincta]|uniref:sensor domain-containing diguanylate cyclase n=1 Tax=Pseudoalteromonas distincta TaxID=77608 RepID=UPI0039E7B998